MGVAVWSEYAVLRIVLEISEADVGEPFGADRLGNASGQAVVVNVWNCR